MQRSLHLFVPIIIACAAMCVPSPARAQAFLFEDVALGDYAGSLSVTNGAQTVTMTPEGFPNGSVSVIDRTTPLLHGVIANQGSTTISDRFAPLRFTFSTPVDSITFGFSDAVGEQGGDIDGSVSISAFDSVGTLLGTMLYNDPGYNGGTYQTLNGSFGSASYFIATTTAPPDNMNSLVYEIVASTPGSSVPVIPEPSSLALLASTLIPGTVLLRRRSTRASA